MECSWDGSGRISEGQDRKSRWVRFCRCGTADSSSSKSLVSNYINYQNFYCGRSDDFGAGASNQVGGFSQRIFQRCPQILGSYHRGKTVKSFFGLAPAAISMVRAKELQA